MTLPPCNARTPFRIMLSHPEPPNDSRGGHHHWPINGWKAISTILFSRKPSHFVETSTSPPSLNAVGMRFYPLPSLLQNTKSLTTLGNVEGLCRKSDSAHSSLQWTWNQTGVWPSGSRTILRGSQKFLVATHLVLFSLQQDPKLLHSYCLRWSNPPTVSTRWKILSIKWASMGKLRCPKESRQLL